MKNEDLYSWLFHYNSYTDKWSAFHRDDVIAYWNGEETIHPVYSHTDFMDLINILDNMNLCS